MTRLVFPTIAMSIRVEIILLRLIRTLIDFKTPLGWHSSLPANSDRMFQSPNHALRLH
jgi:hypothetical protein